MIVVSCLRLNRRERRRKKPIDRRCDCFSFSLSSASVDRHRSIDLDHLSSSLTTPTRDAGENSPIGSGESIKSSDSINTGQQKKKSSSISSQQHSSINGSLSKVSPDRSSDGAGRDDADSVVSFESQKSATNAGKSSSVSSR